MLKPARFYRQHQDKRVVLSSHPNAEAEKIRRLNLAYEKFKNRVDALVLEANQITSDFVRKVDQEKYKKTLVNIKGI